MFEQCSKTGYPYLVVYLACLSSVLKQGIPIWLFGVFEQCSKTGYPYLVVYLACLSSVLKQGIPIWLFIWRVSNPTHSYTHVEGEQDIYNMDSSANGQVIRL